MLTRSTTAVVLLVTILLFAAACGGSGSPGGTAAQGPTTRHAPPAPPAPDPGGFIAVDAAAHTVTITLIASYDRTNSGFNFDGYSRDLMWTVPRGWSVHVVCKNRGPLRHSCAVVHGAGTATPAFPGASTPQPRIGLESGRTSTFTFRAARTGVYRFVCLVPGHEDARMWDVLEIVRHGKPSAVDLRAGR